MKYTVYHGTNAIFDEFKNEYTGQGNDQIGSGFYFTDNPDVAYGYGKNILKCEIEIDNPIRLSQNDYNLDDADIDMSVEDVIKILVKCPNLKDEEESPLLDWMDISDIEWDYVEEYLDGIAQTYVGRLISLEADFFKGYSTEFRKAVNEVLGYDGVIQEFKDGTFYVCWFPEQIKILGSVNENAEVLENPEIIDKSNEKFWKWFNGSKCVDEKGEPLKVYHGTSSKFKSFNKKKLGNKDNNIMSVLGFHFTPDYNMADRLFRKSANDEILECYLSIKNPFVCKESDAVKEALKLGYEKGYIDIESNNFDKLLNMEYFNNQDGGLANILAIDGYHAQRGWEHQFDLKAIGLNYLKYLKSQGYDGIKYLNEIEWAQDNRYDWIAFEPNQIKSVNAKEFSNSSNIYEELNKEIEKYL